MRSSTPIGFSTCCYKCLLRQRQNICRLQLIDRGPPESCALSLQAELSPLARQGAQKQGKNVNIVAKLYKTPLKFLGLFTLYSCFLLQMMVWFVNIIRSSHYLCNTRRKSTVLSIISGVVLFSNKPWGGQTGEPQTYTGRLLMNVRRCLPSPM